MKLLYTVLLEELCPLVFCERMMRIQPAFEGTKLLLQCENFLRIDDGSIDLESVADNACIRHQAGAVFVAVLRDRLQAEAVVGLLEIIGLLENGDPRQARLVDFEDETLEEQVVIRQRKSVLGIVVYLVEGIFRVGVAVVAVGGHDVILL